MTETAAITETVVRQATADDLEALVRMGQRFLAESSYNKHLKNNPAQMRHFTEKMLGNSDGHVLVAEQDGQAVGMLAFYFFPHFYSGELMAGELVWWVEPEHRAGSVGMRLLHEMDRQAKALGAVKVQMIAPNERMGKLYERLGYAWVEATYQKELR